MATLEVGDRVRVVNDYFVAYLRGTEGTITPPSEHIRDHISDGQFWVEFDQLVPDENGGLTEAGAFSGTDLQLLR
jgi:hypothetical protein